MHAANKIAVLNIACPSARVAEPNARRTVHEDYRARCCYVASDHSGREGDRLAKRGRIC